MPHGAQAVLREQEATKTSQSSSCVDPLMIQQKRSAIAEAGDTAECMAQAASGATPRKDTPPDGALGLSSLRRELATIRAKLAAAHIEAAPAVAGVRTHVSHLPPATCPP